jgi:hypothetical protein
MRRIGIQLSALAAVFFVGAASAQCPAFVHKKAIVRYVDSVGNNLQLSGTVVAAALYAPGIYASPLGKNTPTLIPNTQNDFANSLQITEDGKWVLYNSGGPVIINIDGSKRTVVPKPAGASGSDGSVTFWWRPPSNPSGLEVVYRQTGDKIIHAVPVTFGANGPTFGTDHVIAQFTDQLWYTMGVSGNHMFVRVPDKPRMVTLPATGTAAEADYWKVDPTTDYPHAGCMTTISHDGTITCHNPGYENWCTCIADESCLLRHKSFVLLNFQEKTAPSVGWLSVLEKTKAISINWAPEKYLFLSPTDSTKGLCIASSNFWSDFAYWSYTNNNEYVVGHLASLQYITNPGKIDSSAHEKNPDSGTIWLVHYPTNTWTRILTPKTPVTRSTVLGNPAVWIGGTGVITPRQESGRVNGYKEGNSRVFDIRGRIVSGGGALTKIIPGVYFRVTAQGAMKRMVVGR